MTTTNREQGLAGWIADFRWAMNMMRARRYRRAAGFAARIRFDDALRPRLKRGPYDANQPVIAYPDAVYHITVDDVIRAARAALRDKQP